MIVTVDVVVVVVVVVGVEVVDVVGVDVASVAVDSVAGECVVGVLGVVLTTKAGTKAGDGTTYIRIFFHRQVMVPIQGVRG